MATHTAPVPGVIVARPVTTASFLAALDRAEGSLEEDTRGGCDDCDETPGNGKCRTHQAVLDDAALIGRLREALARASESEVAALLAGTGRAA